MAFAYVSYLFSNTLPVCNSGDSLRFCMWTKLERSFLRFASISFVILESHLSFVVCILVDRFFSKDYSDRVFGFFNESFGSLVSI